MTTARTITWGILVWAVMPSVVRAGGFTANSYESGSGWSYFFSGAGGGGVGEPFAVPARSNNVSSDPVMSPLPTSSYAAPSVPNIQPSQPVVATITSQPISAFDYSQAASTPAFTTMSSSNSAPAALSSGSTADAFINFGSSNFLEASSLTRGTPQSWSLSPAVEKVFGGVAPNAQQQAAFTSEVLQDVHKTFQLSGLNPSITSDPSVHASHTLSVVSGASYAQNTNAIGITDVGANGFGFIDKLGYTTDPHQLALAVAHNVSHELMHAFGVAAHHDQTGQYLDSATASWSQLSDPNTTFSPAAAQDIATHLANANQPVSAALLGLEGLNPDGHQKGCQCLLCQKGYQLELGPQSVPEPTTIAAWSLIAGAGLFYRRAGSRRAA